VHEAVKLLEGLKLREPQNIDVHARLKALYAETAEKELAVTECLILHELYKRKGDLESADKELRDAVDIAPADPRLAGRVEPLPVFEPTAYSAAVPENGVAESTEEIEDYEDALAEADFYIRQGLMQEASKILEKMHSLFPENTDITERLESIGHIAESFGSSTMHTGPAPGTPEGLVDEAAAHTPEQGKEPAKLPAEGESGPAEFELEPTGFAADFGGPPPRTPDSYEYPGDDSSAGDLTEADFETPAFEDSGQESTPEYGAEFGTEFEAGFKTETSSEFGPEFGMAPEISAMEPEPAHEEASAPGEQTPDEISPAPEESAFPAPSPEEVPGKEEYEDIMLTEQDLDEAQEMPDLALDNDVLEIFQEFKKGLAKELGDEDSETHYNLGIAYKEMGLVDDAIKEFQSSRSDPKRYIQSSTMLGNCYMEKGLYSLAIDVLKKITLEGTEKDESYWPVRYELAEAYEKNNNLKEALDLYTSVYGWNAKFRGVSEKVSQISAQVGAAKDEPPREGKPPGTAGEKPKTKKDRVSYL
jgi:tetratricopeptide (TPR) repeat protein